jgi:hypothetical protein
MKYGNNFVKLKTFPSHEPSLLPILTHFHSIPLLCSLAIYIVKSIIFWDVKSCSPVEVHRRFGGM